MLSVSTHGIWHMATNTQSSSTSTSTSTSTKYHMSVTPKYFSLSSYFQTPNSLNHLRSLSLNALNQLHIFNQTSHPGAIVPALLHRNGLGREGGSPCSAYRARFARPRDACGRRHDKIHMARWQTHRHRPTLII